MGSNLSLAGASPKATSRVIQNGESSSAPQVARRSSGGALPELRDRHSGALQVVRGHLVLVADGRESLGVGSAAINPEREMLGEMLGTSQDKGRPPFRDALLTGLS
jgi:hypothetical protein